MCTTFIVISISSLFLILTNCQLKHPDLNYDNNLDLAAYTHKIYEVECKNYKTAVIIYTEEDNTASEFLKLVSTASYTTFLTVEISNFSTYQVGNAIHIPEIAFIFVNENIYEDMDSIIYAIEFFSFWRIRGKFLVVATGFETKEDDWIREVFESFWYRQALRVLLCFWQDGIKLYAHNPFLENFGFDVSNRTDIKKIFEYKITNMYGYPIKTYNFDIVMKTKNMFIEKNGKKVWVGPDGVIMSTFVETLNATLEVQLLSTDFSEKVVNEADYRLPITQFMKLFQDIYDFDIIFPAVRTYTDNELDHVFLYERNDIVLIVPRSEHIPEYLYILLIIPIDVFCITITCLIAISLTIYLMKKCFSHRSDFGAIFLDNYRYLLSESSSDQDRKSVEKLLVFLWMMYGIVFTTLFQSIFTSTLIVPKYYPEIDTLSALFKTDLKIYGGAYAIYQIAQILVGENKKLLKHLIAVPTNITVYAEDLDWITDYRRDNGLLLFKDQMYEFEKVDKNAASGSYHIMKESPMPIAFSYNIRRDKLYYEELQKYLGVIQDCGLRQFWRRHNYGKNQTYMYSNNAQEASDTKLLNYKHLKSAFFMLIFGHTAGLLMLFCELVRFNYNKLKTQSQRPNNVEYYN